MLPETTERFPLSTGCDYWQAAAWTPNKKAFIARESSDILFSTTEKSYPDVNLYPTGDYHAALFFSPKWRTPQSNPTDPIISNWGPSSAISVVSGTAVMDFIPTETMTAV